MAGFQTPSALGQLDARLPNAHRSISALLGASGSLKPEVGIVCGSGLGGLAEALEDSKIIAYDDIEGWPKGQDGSGVLGHRKGLAFGKLGGKRVVCQMGRMHCYEGYSIKDVTFAVRMFRLLGCSVVIITNAAGAVNTERHVGQILALHDHVGLPSLTAINPLIGPNFAEVGARFPAMSDAYDFELRKSVFRAAKAIGLAKGAVVEGIYAWATGPTYETRAEGRFIRSMGADVVGMSTVPEVIAARHVGLRVLALSLVTNIVIWDPYRSAEAAVEAEVAGVAAGATSAEPAKAELTANHEEVLAVGREKAKDVLQLVTHVVQSL